MPNKMERFTNHSRLVLQFSEIAAREFSTHLINPMHLLLAMTRAEDTDAHYILSDFDIIASKLAPFLKAKQMPKIHGYADETPPIELSKDYKTILERSVDAARRRGHHFIGTAHMVIGLMLIESEEINAILHHFDVQSKEIIKLASQYLAEDKSLESELNEAQIHFHKSIQAAKTSDIQGFLRRIFRLNKKRKRSE